MPLCSENILEEPGKTKIIHLKQFLTLHVRIMCDFKTTGWVWRHDSSGRVPILQIQSPEFKLHYHQKINKQQQQKKPLDALVPPPRPFPSKFLRAGCRDIQVFHAFWVILMCPKWLLCLALKLASYAQLSFPSAVEARAQMCWSPGTQEPPSCTLVSPSPGFSSFSCSQRCQSELKLLQGTLGRRCGWSMSN
jgi:hypothetical protein